MCVCVYIYIYIHGQKGFMTYKALKSCNHENNVPSQLSPQSLCANSCTSAHDVRHVPKCMSCHKTIVVITRRAYCFHDCIYIYIYIYKSEKYVIYQECSLIKQSNIYSGVGIIYFTTSSFTYVYNHQVNKDATNIS